MATPDLQDGQECYFHSSPGQSHIIKRVVRATLQGEAYELQSGVESGDILRPAIAYMFKTVGRDWESDAAVFMRHVWVSDCESVVSALNRPGLGKTQGKRLGIELAAMRQSLWRTPGMATWGSGDGRRESR